MSHPVTDRRPFLGCEVCGRRIREGELCVECAAWARPFCVWCGDQVPEEAPDPLGTGIPLEI